VERDGERGQEGFAAIRPPPAAAPVDGALARTVRRPVSGLASWFRRRNRVESPSRARAQWLS